MSTKRSIFFPLWVRCGLLLGLVLLTLLFSWWRRQLERDVDRRLMALQAQGVPLNGLELDRSYPSVARAANSGLILEEAFASLHTFKDERQETIQTFELPPVTHRLPSEELELLAAYVEMNANALEQAEAALLLGDCRYSVDLRSGYFAKVPHLGELKSLARVAWYRTVVESHRANTEACLEAILLQLRLSETLSSEPTILSQLVRVAILSMATDSIQRALSFTEWNSQQLAALEDGLGSLKLTNMLSLGCQGEVGAAVPLFLNYEATLRGMQNSGNPEESDQDPALLSKVLDPLLIRMTGFGQRDLRFYLSVMETNLTLAQAPLPDSLEAFRMRTWIEQEVRDRKYILSALLLPALGKFPLRHAETAASVESAKTAVAIETGRLETGSPPNQLELLLPDHLNKLPTDPFDGQPLRYRKLAHGYILYSVGKDGQDDGGCEPPSRINRTDTNSYDLTFIVER